MPKIKKKKRGPLIWVFKKSVKIEEINTQVILALAPVEICSKCLSNDLWIFLIRRQHVKELKVKNRYYVVFLLIFRMFILIFLICWFRLVLLFYGK